MVKFVCDRCRRVMEADEICGCHISYMNENGNNGVDLCKECFEEFLNWMKNEPFNDKGIYINGLGECAGVLLTHGTSG